ncbi:hypothetical protein CRG98_022815 [Punica granatum]|uniref:Uncharacterized protein n=1 Tax=Punica granatum TaxID=22663 RepID=A0A2I0JKJ4_PUNGR|nr:hypothetical protein CRG98_022815 [Punica granatum]
MRSSHEAHWPEWEPAKRWASKGRWWEWSQRRAWEQGRVRSEADLRTTRDARFDETEFLFNEDKPTNSTNTGPRFLDTSGPAIQGEQFGPLDSNLAQNMASKSVELNPAKTGLRLALFPSTEPS